MVPVRGHQSHWRAYRAVARSGVIILACAACLGAQDQQKGASPDKGAYQDNRGTTQAPLVVETHPAPKTAKEASADKAEANQKSANDTNMVKLTSILAAIGFLQLLVFGYQSLQLRRTVSDSKDVIAAAQRSAKAAEESLAKSDEMLTHSRDAHDHSWKRDKRIERAYIFGVEYGYNISADGTYHTATIWVQNAGKTPAIVDNIKWDFITLPTPDGPNLGRDYADHLDIAMASGEKKNIFEAGGPFVGFPVIFYGTVFYTDVFGEAHETRFSQRFLNKNGEIYNVPCGGAAWHVRT